MKLAIIGPGYGHNIKPYLMFFNDWQKDQVDFYYHHKDSFSDEYTNISFLPIPNKLLHLFFNAKKYDVVWLMGGGRLLYVIAFMSFFMKKNSKLVIFPYGERLPRETNKKTIKGWFLRKVLSCFTCIHCGWYGIADLLNPKLKSKILIQVMGINKDFYKVSTNPHKEICKLLEIINENEYNFYYPKSFLKVSRHDLVIEAVKILKENGEKLPPFKVYFLGGNEQDNQRYEELQGLISTYNLCSDIIFLQKTIFFKTEDLNLIWGKMNCGLQIAQHDGLSTTIFEPLVNEKELIISDISPYRYLDDYFGVEFNLTPLTAQAIAREMKNKILNINTRSKEKKQKIKVAIKEKYSFESNIEKLLLRFEKGI